MASAPPAQTEPWPPPPGSLVHSRPSAKMTRFGRTLPAPWRCLLLRRQRPARPAGAQSWAAGSGPRADGMGASSQKLIGTHRGGPAGPPPSGGDDITLEAAGRDTGQQMPEGWEGPIAGARTLPTPLSGKVAAPRLENILAQQPPGRTAAGTSCTREGAGPPRADPRPTPRVSLHPGPGSQRDSTQPPPPDSQGARCPLIPKFAPSHTHSPASPTSPQPLPLCPRRTVSPLKGSEQTTNVVRLARLWERFGFYEGTPGWV
nr:basic proline-rich protein-like [Odocoileus virginianus texanus]